jgi:hypothetical protein
MPDKTLKSAFLFALNCWLLVGYYAWQNARNTAAGELSLHPIRTALRFTQTCCRTRNTQISLFRFQVSDAPMQVMEDTEKFVVPPFGGSGPVGFQVESQTALSA